MLRCHGVSGGRDDAHSCIGLPNWLTGASRACPTRLGAAVSSRHSLTVVDPSLDDWHGHIRHSPFDISTLAAASYLIFIEMSIMSIFIDLLCLFALNAKRLTIIPGLVRASPPPVPGKLPDLSILSASLVKPPVQVHSVICVLRQRLRCDAASRLSTCPHRPSPSSLGGV